MHCIYIDLLYYRYICFHTIELLHYRLSSRAMKQWKKLRHGRLIVVPGPLKRHTPV